MPKRKFTATEPGTMSAQWKARIQTTMIVKRLNDCAKGEITMTSEQVRAALGLLKKVMPDLSVQQHGQDPNSAPVQVDMIQRPALSREEWLKLHGNR